MSGRGRRLAGGCLGGAGRLVDGAHLVEEEPAAAGGEARLGVALLQGLVHVHPIVRFVERELRFDRAVVQGVEHLDGVGEELLAGLGLRALQLDRVEPAEDLDLFEQARLGERALEGLLDLLVGERDQREELVVVEREELLGAFRK